MFNQQCFRLLFSLVSIWFYLLSPASDLYGSSPLSHFDNLVSENISSIDMGNRQIIPPEDPNLVLIDATMVAEQFVRLRDIYASPEASRLLDELTGSKAFEEECRKLSKVALRNPESCYAACLLLTYYSFSISPSWQIVTPAMGVAFEQLMVPLSVRTEQGNYVLRAFCRYMEKQIVVLVMNLDYDNNVQYYLVNSSNRRFPSIERKANASISRDDLVVCGQIVHLCILSGAFNGANDLSEGKIIEKVVAENMDRLGVSASEWRGSGLVSKLIFQASLDRQDLARGDEKQDISQERAPAKAASDLEQKIVLLEKQTAGLKDDWGIHRALCDLYDELPTPPGPQYPPLKYVEASSLLYHKVAAYYSLTVMYNPLNTEAVFRESNSALVHIEAALLLEPDSPTLVAMKAWALLYLGRIKEARETLRRAEALDPDDAFMIYVRGSFFIFVE